MLISKDYVVLSTYTHVRNKRRINWWFVMKFTSSFRRNFQLAVARKTLGRVEERNDVSLFEQRQAFSSLRAIRSGKRVGSIRTGHRVREYYPGTVPQVSAIQITKPNSKIQIYQVRC